MKEVMLNLDQFCSSDDTNGLHLPFTSEGYVYATNGHILIRCCKESYPEITRPISELKIRVDRFNDLINEADIFEPIDASIIEAAIASYTPAIQPDLIDRMHEWIPCPACNGRKTVTRSCEYCDDDHQCPCGECDEKGEVKRSWAFGGELNKSVDFSIGVINWNYLRMAYNALNQFDGPIEMFWSEPLKPLHLKKPGIHIVIMPMRARN